MATSIALRATARSIRLDHPAIEDARRSEFSILVAAVPLAAALVIGMSLGSVPVSLAAIGAVLLASIVSPAVGLAVLAFIAPIGPQKAVPAPGSDVLLVGAILLGCVYRLPIDRPRPRTSALAVIITAFVVYVTAQQLPELLNGYRGSLDHDVGYLFIQLLTCFGTILAATYVLSNRSPYPFLVMALAGAALVAVLAILTYDATTIPAFIVNLVPASDNLTRALGSFSNPNYLGAYTAALAVIAAALASRVRSRRYFFALVGLAALSGVGVVISLSRGAIVAALVGVSWLALARSRALAAFVLAAAVIGAFVIYPAFVEWRLQNLTGSASAESYAIMAESDHGRLTGTLAGPLLFLTAPLFGIGFGHFVPLSVLVTNGGEPINAHNWYLTVLAEQGIVGVVLVGALAVALVRALRSRPPRARTVGFAVLGCLAAQALFLEPPTSFQMLAAPAIVLVAALVGDWREEPSDTADQASDRHAVAADRRIPQAAT
jgi:O-antigen ligase